MGWVTEQEAGSCQATDGEWATCAAGAGHFRGHTQEGISHVLLLWIKFLATTVASGFLSFVLISGGRL